MMKRYLSIMSSRTKWKCAGVIVLAFANALLASIWPVKLGELYTNISNGTINTISQGMLAVIMLMLSLAVMISLCHADMRLPGYLSWNVSCDGAAIRPYHGRA